MAENETKNEVLQIRCESALLDRINEQRRKEADPPSKAGMARILIVEALTAREAGSKKKGGK